MHPYNNTVLQALFNKEPHNQVNYYCILLFLSMNYQLTTSDMSQIAVPVEFSTVSADIKFNTSLPVKLLTIAYSQLVHIITITWFN